MNRRRRGRLVLAGLLFGAAAGSTAALAAGARQSDTAFDRFREEARGADAIVGATQVGVINPDWGALIEAPEVEAASPYALVDLQFEDADGLFAFPPAEDGGLYRTMEVPNITSGRLPDPGHADEIVVSTAAHDGFGIEVGDRLTARAPQEGDEGEFTGPILDLVVVGVGDAPFGLSRFPDAPFVYLPSTFISDHPEVPHASNLMVRLRHGEADIDALRATALEVLGVEVPILDLGEAAERVREGTRLERNGLLILAAGLGVVTAFVAAQVLTGLIDAAAEDAMTFRALGMTRRERAVTVARPAGVVGAVALATTVVAAIALSPLVPIGLAGRIDPGKGVRVDVSVLVLVLVGLLVLVAAVSVVRAWIVASPAPPSRHRSPSWTVRVVRALRLPVPAAAGLRLAADRSGPRSRDPVRRLLVAMVVGMVGVIAAATTATGLDDAIDDPARTGQRWEAFYVPEDVDGLRSELLDRPDVEGVVATRFAILPLAHGKTLTTYALEHIRGPDELSLLEGRAPTAPDEVALGPLTADRLGVDVGDRLTLGPSAEHDARVVGVALMPQLTGAGYDEGGWVTRDGMDRLADLAADGDVVDALMVHFRDGGEGVAYDPLETNDGLLASELEPAIPVVSNLRTVGRLPWVEAGFFVVLTIGAFVLLLRSAWRRLRHELATMRVLGLTPRQAAAMVGWQATVLAVMSLVIGVPIGLAVGNVIWREIARSIPVLYHHPVPWGALAVVVPATIAVAVVLAIGPARRAARLPPSTALRTE